MKKTTITLLILSSIIFSSCEKMTIESTKKEYFTWSSWNKTEVTYNYYDQNKQTISINGIEDNILIKSDCNSKEYYPNDNFYCRVGYTEHNVPIKKVTLIYHLADLRNLDKQEIFIEGTGYYQVIKVIK